MVSRVRKRADLSPVTPDQSSHINYRYLTTPEKVERIRSLKRGNRALSSRIKRLQAKVEAEVQYHGVTLDTNTSSDLLKIVSEEDCSIPSKYGKNSFQHIFWKTQKDYLAREGHQKKGIRWHPLMIKWCLYLRHQSSKSYETLRESGIALPSQRTLRDYSNAVKAGSGFSVEVDKQLISAAKLSTSPNYHRLIVLLIDEMHVREDLVYNKHSGRLSGFVDLGEVNNHFTR